MPQFAEQAYAEQLPTVSERVRLKFPEYRSNLRKSSGQNAIDRLGSRLPEIAAWYGYSAVGLRRQLLSDRRLKVDERGRLFVVEEMEAPLQNSAAGPELSVSDGQLVPLEQTFQLHSRPGARRTIYLDFDGATLSNTAWNVNNNVINAAPFDFDGNPASFSVAELQRIQFIWQRVAEDYSVFDVDVTTEAPPPELLIRTSANDETFGTTAVITNNNGVYSCSCGGVAYIGAFNEIGSFYKPALVFYNMLGSGDEKSVAEAISHEVGHNIGLSHDGTSSMSYYTGQGSDPVTGWAPIMGIGYYKPLVQFSRGEYASANNTEDDFVQAQRYGLPLRADDYGNTISNATPLPSGSGSLDGVIESPGDADMFSFSVSENGYNVSVTLSPASRSPNADLVLTLFDSRGQQLASSNPINALNASISYQLPVAGTYYVSVTTTGQGNPYTTGYSAYGSVGNYRAAISFTRPPANSLSVINPSLSLKIAKKGSARATAQLVIVNEKGQPLRGATVSASWSGAVSGTRSLRTKKNGTVQFLSRTTKQTGCITFTITNILLKGYIVNPAALTSTTVCR